MAAAAKEIKKEEGKVRKRLQRKLRSKNKAIEEMKLKHEEERENWRKETIRMIEELRAEMAQQKAEQEEEEKINITGDEIELPDREAFELVKLTKKILKENPNWKNTWNFR